MSTNSDEFLKTASVSRRGFLKGCTIAAAALGLSDVMVPRLVEAAANPQRPPVVWLHFQECTGCTESLLRGSHPDIGRLWYSGRRRGSTN